MVSEYGAVSGTFDNKFKEVIARRECDFLLFTNLQAFKIDKLVGNGLTCGFPRLGDKWGNSWRIQSVCFGSQRDEDCRYGK
jgi:hypothetical protein